MPGTAFVARLPLRCAFCLACLLAPALAAPAQAEQGAAPALSPPKKQKLQERDRLAAQVSQLQQQGKMAEAIATAQKMLAIERQVFGNVHEEVAGSLEWLAGAYQQREDFAAARTARLEVLAIRTKLYGPKDWRVADAHRALADLEHYSVLKPAQRAQLAQARKLTQQAVALYGQGKAREAISDTQRALAIRKEVLGELHPDYAECLNNLAVLYQMMDEQARAEPLYRQALQIRKQSLGEQHPEYANTLHNLASLYDKMGDYARAEPLYRQALLVFKQTLGEQHPYYTATLNSLAGLYENMGDCAQAELLYRQALEIRKQALGEQHPDYAASLNNLALLYWSMGEHARAEPLLRQALPIFKKAQGEQHSNYASCLTNLGTLYDAMGEHARAEPLLRQAVQILKQALGEQHPEYAKSLNNLALAYQYMGEYAKAEPLHLKVLQIYKQTLGEQHPAYANSLNNLARLYRARGDHARAEPLLRQAVDLWRANLELAAAAQSQRQQLAMLAQLRFYLDSYMSLVPQTPQDIVAQYRAVLAWKGAVGCRQRLQHLARTRPDLARDFAALDQLSSRLASLALATPDPAQRDERRRQIQQLTQEKDQREATLARKSMSFEQERQRQHLEPAQLQAALPTDGVLLDFLEYNHERPAPSKKGRRQWQRRLAAFVIDRQGLRRVDLGPAQQINAAVEGWRLALQRRFRTEGDARLGEQVRHLVWEPLQSYLHGASVVLVSPDGPLDRIPFAALPGSKKDSYLLEDVALAVIPIPQLLPLLLASHSNDSKAEPSLLLVGNVAYDKAVGSAAVADSRPAPRGGALMHWQPLEATLAEVRAIRGCFEDHFPAGQITTLSSSRATEAAVRKQAPTHRYLHLATHGFFAPKELRSALAAVSHGDKEDIGNLFARRDVAGFHPGLLCGLVLAGANEAPQPGQDDGILTALEVEALELSHVELAALSACETGLGEEAGGEGLLGLQRAFQLAGARSVVASLWQVDDKATRELMVRFYENLWDKKLSKLEALRQAQLWMLREGAGRGMVDVRVPKERLPVEDGRLAPYYWAAFSLSGDWR